MENFLFTGLFWGAILILAGLLVVLNGILNLQIPTFRIIIAVIFVAVGITLLSGGFKIPRQADNNSVVFGTGKIEPQAGATNEYTIVFGSGLVDLSDIVPDKGIVNVKVTTAFGSGVIEIKSGTPVRIKATAAFGDVRLPDDSYVSFGHNVYESENIKKSGNYLSIDATAAFGSLKFVRK